MLGKVFRAVWLWRGELTGFASRKCFRGMVRSVTGQPPQENSTTRPDFEQGICEGSLAVFRGGR